MKPNVGTFGVSARPGFNRIRTTGRTARGHFKLYSWKVTAKCFWRLVGDLQRYVRVRRVAHFHRDLRKLSQSERLFPYPSNYKLLGPGHAAEVPSPKP